ncbi:TPA: NADH-quinone oxidoreductase subunit NuoE [Candidatus Poribacteria bacterium]|nr:NADH-quinone oxidoreductase subunit NuoE [Candidatus Poribacteria bacterium]
MLENQKRDPSSRSKLLSALYIAQERYGYLSKEAMDYVAKQLSIPLKDVYSTASFYSLFRMKPAGEYVIQVCEGLSCFLNGGAERLVDYLSKKLGIKVGETTPDGKFTLEVVQCLASCGTSPTMRINDELYENLTKEKVNNILEQLVGENANGKNIIKEL